MPNYCRFEKKKKKRKKALCQNNLPTLIVENIISQWNTKLIIKVQ